MKISYFLPPSELANEELERLYDSPQWTTAKIFRGTGIKKRRIATDELVSDLAVGATEKLFSEHDIDRVSIDFVLVCTQSPDYFLPNTACMMQDRLGLKKTCGALDFNLGCSGFLYGLALANGLLLSKIASRVLLITADTITKHIHPKDRSTRVLFGDAGAAVLLDHNTALNTGQFVFGTDGSGAKNLISPLGGMTLFRDQSDVAEETDENGNIRTKKNFYMNGIEILIFSLREVPPLVADTLTANKMNINDIDYFIFHQANRFMLETLRDNLNISKEKFCIDIEEFGNTSASTIPIALRRAIDRGTVREGMKVLIAGFGVGYSWAATIITI